METERILVMYRAILFAIGILLVCVAFVGGLTLLAWQDASHNRTVLDARTSLLCDIAKANDIEDDYCNGE